jgi:hypothetical protein
MELSTEVIQARVLEDFEVQLNEFHEQCENNYIDLFRRRIVSGDVDPYDPHYRDVCSRETQVYKKEICAKTYDFVRSYVDTTFDVIVDSQREGIFTKDEAVAAQNALRHILIAAEIDHDSCTKDSIL